MTIVGTVLTYVLSIFLILVIGRLVLEIVQSFARSWKPSRPIAVIAEITYTVTDPVVKPLRRYIPAVRLGNVGLDLSYTILIFVLWAMIIFVQRL